MVTNCFKELLDKLKFKIIIKIIRKWNFIIYNLRMLIQFSIYLIDKYATTSRYI